MNNDLKKIKKYYGEDMMKLCREIFPTILETEGLLLDVLESTFAHNKFLCRDIKHNFMVDEFKNYIFSYVDVENKRFINNKNPKELLSEAGYNLYECKTEDDIQSFKKYYAKDEVICTFNGGRLNKCYVFFAVKKNVDEIRREDFPNPKREDLYGTSVISIQFSKGSVNTVSIKNRYNHHVNNPDATFCNNLDNIIYGLTSSFSKKYKFRIGQNYIFNFDMPGYIRADDGRFYKYNYEINDVYYCINNIIVDYSSHEKYVVHNEYSFENSNRYILFDYYIIDLKRKKVFFYDNRVNDSFPDFLDNISKIYIGVSSDGNKLVNVSSFDYNSIIELDSSNRIVGFYSDSYKSIGNRFMFYNSFLKEIDLPNVSEIGYGCLMFNEVISSLNLPSIKRIGQSFMTCRNSVDVPFENLNVSKDYLIGDYSLDLSGKAR